MSAAATTGYGMAAVATAQSVGAAGLGVAGKVVVATAGAAVGGYVSGDNRNKECHSNCDN